MFKGVIERVRDTDQVSDGGILPILSQGSELARLMEDKGKPSSFSESCACKDQEVVKLCKS